MTDFSLGPARSGPRFVRGRAGWGCGGDPRVCLSRQPPRRRGAASPPVHVSARARNMAGNTRSRCGYALYVTWIARRLARITLPLTVSTSALAAVSTLLGNDIEGVPTVWCALLDTVQRVALGIEQVLDEVPVPVEGDRRASLLRDHDGALPEALQGNTRLDPRGLGHLRQRRLDPPVTQPHSYHQPHPAHERVAEQERGQGGS